MVPAAYPIGGIEVSENQILALNVDALKFIKFYRLFTARRSISSKHNNSSDGKSTVSFTKSYTNTKKEELMKVINEAKAKLENVSKFA